MTSPYPLLKTSSVPRPLGQCLKERYNYFGCLPCIESCWGHSLNIPWTKREYHCLGLVIPLEEGQDDLVMYCSQSLAHYGGRYWKEKERGVDPQTFHAGSSYPTCLAGKGSKRCYFSLASNAGFCCFYTIIALVSSSLQGLQWSPYGAHILQGVLYISAYFIW